MVSQLKRVIVGVKAVKGNLPLGRRILVPFGDPVLGRHAGSADGGRSIWLRSRCGPIAEPFLECRSRLYWRYWPDYDNRGQVGTKRRVVIALHVLQSERTDGFRCCLAQSRDLWVAVVLLRVSSRPDNQGLFSSPFERLSCLLFLHLDADSGKAGCSSLLASNCTPRSKYSCCTWSEKLLPANSLAAISSSAF